MVVVGYAGLSQLRGLTGSRNEILALFNLFLPSTFFLFNLFPPPPLFFHGVDFFSRGGHFFFEGLAKNMHYKGASFMRYKGASFYALSVGQYALSVGQDY